MGGRVVVVVVAWPNRGHRPMPAWPMGCLSGRPDLRAPIMDELPLELVHLIVSQVPLSVLPRAARTCHAMAAFAEARRRIVRPLQLEPFALSSRTIVSADEVCCRDRALNDANITTLADACVSGACQMATAVRLSGNEVSEHSLMHRPPPPR